MPHALRICGAMQFILLMGCYCCFAQAGQSQAIDWQVNVRKSDQIAIIKLAKQLGIHQPIRVTKGITTPGECRFIHVESTIVEDGNRRNWLELSMRRQDWHACFAVEPGASTKKVGRWIASETDLIKREKWRIRDNEWFVDLSLTDVPYTDAEMIVHAIRRGALINRLAGVVGTVNPNNAIPKIDPSNIFSIKKGDKDARTYEVWTGQLGGQVYHVSIVNDQVELLSYNMWLV